ncbi:katanin p80 WD40 repeat-containing subunit B1-like isoform X2 [Ornithodoros turicata]|uniref:katanin p80 WD40 repeat-containing subunit B1-like isoform X2 n=1 Tax=Ornithodoros turicata TaxID=34597 RepID=UPI00313872E6
MTTATKRAWKLPGRRGLRAPLRPATRRNKFWQLEEFVAHGASVNCLSIGRKSGRVMVTGGQDKKVNLWAVGKTNCIMSLTGHTTPVECVKFCHTEEMVCAGSMSGALKIWDLEAAKIIRTLTGHKANVRCVDFHPYGDFVASGSMDTTVKLWDTRRKGCIYTYKGHNKCINSLKFSPDGRWIASGSEDGSVKLWDLPAGKMLAEFHDHCGPVNDVDFHPNEFLLASGGSDRTVKFWDLESLQLVSSTEGDSGVVRCIYFNPDGACLYTGADDLLKVYSWEPTKTYDTLVMGWSRLADISVAQNQLIAGTFSVTNVSVYVVDLKRVQPFGNTPSTNSLPQDNQALPQGNPFRIGSNTRRSFSRNDKDSRDLHAMKMKPLEDETAYIVEGERGDADIKDIQDYNEIFHPARELSRTPPKDIPFPAPPEDSVKPICTETQPRKVVRFCGSGSCILPKPTRSTVKGVQQMSATSTVSSLSATYTVRSRGTLVGSGALLPQEPAQSVTAAVPGSVGVVPINLPPSLPARSTSSLHTSSVISTTSSTNLVKPMEKATAMVRTSSQIIESSTVSIVKPVMSVPPDSKEVAHFPQKAVVHPEQKTVIDFVPAQRDTPAGLDLDEFLPRHLQENHNSGFPMQPEMPEAEAIATIMEQHKTIMTVVHHRLKNIKLVLAHWSTKEPKAAIDTALSMNDLSVIVDIFSVIAIRPQIWNLNMCQMTLPAIYDLLQSKYESYMSVGCLCLRVILKHFGPTIKTNITAPPGVGVDISREERYNKCMSCYNQLLSIRAFLLKRQTMQGKLGHSFRELHILMQCLE